MGSLIDDKQEYAESYLQDLPPETYSRIKKEGVPFGIWEKYRKTYAWEFAIPKDKETLSIGVSFFNGESYRSHYPFNDQSTQKPVPSSIGFTCKLPNNKTKYVYSIGFDYEETNDVLAKLSANDQQVTILIDPRLPKPSSTISLTNGKETVELKKIIHR